MSEAVLSAVQQPVANGQTVRPAVAVGGNVAASTAKKAIVVCTPTLGTVSMQWAVTIADLVWPMNCSRGLMPLLDMVGDEIGECRNKLVKMCLEMEKPGKIEVDSIFWLDDDVITHRMAICALARHDREIAAGVYFCKGDVGEPLIFPGPSQRVGRFTPTVATEAGEGLESWGWPQGLCLIKLDVYKRMLAECPEMGTDKYGNPRWYHKPDFALDENGFLTAGGTEDFPFFARAAQLGYKPLVDCSKHAFGWHYDLEKKVAYPTKQWDQFIRRKPITWKTPDGEIVWE